MSWFGTLLGALAVLVGYTAQNVTIVYWTDASVNAYGILLICGCFFGAFFGLALLLFALAFRDPAALAASDDARECRLFVWPFCRGASAEAGGGGGGGGGASAASAGLLSPRKGDLSGSYGVLLAEDGAGRGGGGGGGGGDTEIYAEVRQTVRLTRAQVLALVGFLNAMNGFLIVYASPSARTPPLVQAIIQNAGVIFSVPFSLLALGDRKRYCSPAPVLAALLIAASVGVSLAPALLGGGPGALGSGASAIGWCLVYLLGVAASAAYNVCQQLFFVRAGMLRPRVSVRTQARTMLRALFWANVAQPAAYLCMFWVDLLPWFGTSRGLAPLLRATVFSAACSLGGPGVAAAALGAVAGVAPPPAPASPSAAVEQCEASTPVWAWAFLMAYTLSYVGAARLNRESATFMMLTLVVVTMTTAAFWLVPGTNPNPSSTPLWSVLTSLALSVAGTLLWKRWEGATPADEQFGVGPDPDVLAEGDGDDGDGGGNSLADERLERALASEDGGSAGGWGGLWGSRGRAAGGGAPAGSPAASGSSSGAPRGRREDALIGLAYDSLLGSDEPALVDVVTSGRSEIAGIVNKFQLNRAQKALGLAGGAASRESPKLTSPPAFVRGGGRRAGIN